MKRIILFTVLTVCVTIIACHKEQPEMNSDIQDPCDLTHEVSANFYMEEIAFLPTERVVNTDTILYGHSVRFRPVDTTVECTWYIGNEVLTEQVVVRSFDNSLINQTLPITMVAKKSPNNICFPNDDGYDSIVKYLIVSNKSLSDVYDLPNHLFEGTFRFKDSLGNHSTDSVDIDIELNYHSENGMFFGNRMKITHLYGQDSTVFFSSNDLTYRKLWIGGSEFYNKTSFYHAPNGRVVFEMIQGLAIERPSIYFIGRKLN